MKKTHYVADGCMTFINALINQHHANDLDVYRCLVDLCQAQADRLESLKPDRNR